MRTNVVIDETLMASAMKVTGLSTKKAVIEEALRTLVRLKEQEQIRTLRGKLHWEGDLDAIRADRFADVPEPRRARGLPATALSPSMWIVDSSVWIDYFNGVVTPQADLLHKALGQQELGLGDIILCEVLQGFKTQRDFARARSALLRLPVFTIGGREIALKSAENYRTLRRQGMTVRKTVDCLIATFVIERGFSLLHSDRDFAPFAQALGLDVVQA